MGSRVERRGAYHARFYHNVSILYANILKPNSLWTHGTQSDPSSGLPASVTLKANETDVWTIGNHPWSSNIFGETNVFSIANVQGNDRLAMTQTGHLYSLGEEYVLATT